MKALVLPTQPFQDGWLVVDYAEQQFDVAEPLVWLDVPDDIWQEYKQGKCQPYCKDGAIVAYYPPQPEPTVQDAPVTDGMQVL